jgi:hypothetical protein
MFKNIFKRQIEILPPAKKADSDMKPIAPTSCRHNAKPIVSSRLF